jgi:TP901 family phage tail tape measure protein
MAKPIVVKITGDASGFKKALDGASGMLSNFSKAVGATVLAGGAAAAGAIAGGVKAFADFETGLSEVMTLLPEAGADTFDALSEQVKDFSKEFGVLPTETIPALYQALSAGVPQDNVFEFLETAQQAAKGGVTDLETAVDGISSVVNAYGDDVISATEASDLMFTAVRLGKTNFEELSGSLFQVAPIAASLGVEFEDVTASLANLTAQGVPTSVAATQMKGALSELGKEGTKASDAFLELSGQTFTDFIASGGDVGEAFILMSEGAEEAGGSVLDMFGSIEAGQAVLGLTADGGEAFMDTLGEMGESAGATGAAFDTMDGTMASSFDKIKSNIAVLAVELGERVAPVVEKVTAFILDNFDTYVEYSARVREFLRPIFEKIVEFAGTVVTFFRDNWPTIRSVIETVMEAVGVAIEYARGIIEAMVQWVVDNKDTFIGVFEAIQKAVVAVFEIISDVVSFFVDLFKSSTESVDGEASKFTEIFEKIKEFVITVFEAITVAIETAVAAIMYLWRNFGDELLGVIKIAWETILDVVSGALDIITGVIDTFIGLFTGDWGRLWDGLKGIVTGAFDAIAALFEYYFKVLGAALDLAWEGFKAAFTALWDALTEPVSKAWNKIKTVVSDKLEAIKRLFKSAKDGVVRAFSGIWDGIKDGAKAAFNGVADIWNSTIGKLSFKVPSWVPGLGGKGWDVPDIPTFALGGSMSRDGLAIVGERGPELVSLPKGARVSPSHAGPSMAGATINVTANTNANPYDIAREVSWALLTQGG